MNRLRLALPLAAALAIVALPACQNASPTAKPAPGDTNVGPTLSQVPGHDSVTQDTSSKEAPRLVPPEAYIRTYMNLFGGLSPLQIQQQFAGGANNGLFDNWNLYLGALGLPRYETDLPRRGETNAVMIATFERLGIALCDKAVERDLKGVLPVADRIIFKFDQPKGELALADFTTRFDGLHRAFLGYPAVLAPTDRTNRFYKLYQDTAAAHDPKASKLTANEAGWAAMCYGLIRHPEFHVY